MLHSVEGLYAGLLVHRQVHGTSRPYPAQHRAEAAHKSMHTWKGQILDDASL